MNRLYEKTQDKIKYLRSLHYRVHTIWECEFNRLKKCDKLLNVFIENKMKKIHELNYKPNLMPRDGLYGGRVNAAKLYHKVEKNEKILYYDFTSLYPFVLRKYEYPLGHPVILRDIESNDVSKYKGLIYCTILPPRN